MPLQIRRGTELQRLTMTVPLASGELLYVTDDQRLYIGNGTTLGGVPITGYNDENAVDAVGAALVAGVHSGITFTYGTTQDAAGRIDASVDLSNYSGTLRADAIRGTIVADDSTILVDAVSGRIVGPVFSNVVGNVTGNLIGNVTGDINGIVTGTAGSTLTGTVTGNLVGNSTGYHFGDMSGSVFADDSTLLVDAVDGVLRGTHIGIVVSTDVTTEILTVSRDTTAGFSLSVDGLSDNVDTSSGLEFSTSRGSISSPTDLNVNDKIFMIVGKAWKQDQSDYMISTAIEAVVESAYIGGQDVVPTKLNFYTSDGTRDYDAGNLEMSFDGDGKLSAPTVEARNTFNLPIFADTIARDAAITSPTPGMMIFITGTGMQVRGATGWNTIAGTAT